MSGEKNTVLVVDDDPMFRDAVCRILRKHEYDAIEVSKSIHVYNAITKKKPNLILLDIHMPEAGGVEVIHMMKRKDIRVPVIIISGHLNNVDFHILSEHGIKHFLAKPVHLKTIVTKVDEVINLHTT